jgi:hypothetical protein
MENDYAFAYLEDKYTFILQIIKVKDMCAMYTINTSRAQINCMVYISTKTNTSLFIWLQNKNSM